MSRGPAAAVHPVGVCLGSIGATVEWWVDSARRLEAAGYAGAWCWDHFVSRGRRTTPVLEAWTTLTTAAARTTRLTVGTLVANVMNRHPAVLARMAATLQEASGGRLILGIGIGGHPAEHEAYGIPFPDVPERVARLEEAVAVLRALWTGGPVVRDGTFYPLHDAVAHPRPVPPPPIIVGGETRGGARLAARVGDGWAAAAEHFDDHAPVYRAALEAAGRRRSDTTVLAVFGGMRAGDALRDSPWVAEPRAEWDRWRELGADGVVVTARTTADVDRLVDAAGRW